MVDIGPGVEAFDLLVHSAREESSGATDTSTWTHQLQLNSINTSPSDNLGLPSGFGLQQVYDRLFDTYLRPLPQAIPGRHRVATERHVRNAATLISLSGHTISLRKTRATRKHQLEAGDDRRPHSFTISVGHGRPPNFIADQETTQSSQQIQDTLGGDADETNQRLPGPVPPNEDLQQKAGEGSSQLMYSQIANKNQSRSQGQGFELESGNDPHSAAEGKDEDPSSQRLRRLISLNPQPRLPKKLSNILDHWTVGANPEDYDWTATRQRIEAAEAAALAQQQEEESDDDERSRRRKKRREARRLRKEAKEAATPRNPIEVSSTYDDAPTSSAYTPFSSQREFSLPQTSSQPVPQSQLSTVQEVEDTDMLDASQQTLNTHGQESGLPIGTLPGALAEGGNGLPEPGIPALMDSSQISAQRTQQKTPKRPKRKGGF